MPSKSPAQKRLMQAVANNKEFAKKVGVPQKVGKEFVKADKTVKMAGGGLYANIAAKRARGEPMRKAGAAGAPKKSDFDNAAKTAKFAEGGKSSVNEAGNYTKPTMRKALFEKIKSQAVMGTGAGQWSARKAGLLAKQYKSKGGGYRD